MEPPLPVLLVEDDKVDQEVIIRCLKPHAQHFTLTVAPDARQAIMLLSSTLIHFDIIVLDLNLPGLEGLEFLHMLDQQPNFKESIVIILTGSGSDQDRSQANNYCVAGYLLKEQLDSHCTQLINLLEAYRYGRQGRL